MLEELERAVRTREIMLNSRSKYKDRIEKIKKERNELLLLMTACEDGSVRYENFERQIDVLDQQEFELHSKYKKILQAADKEINDSVARIVQRRFGPSFCSDSASGNAPNHDERAN